MKPRIQGLKLMRAENRWLSQTKALPIADVLAVFQWMIEDLPVRAGSEDGVFGVD